MDFIAGEILYFNKPLTWTSFDLVNKFRYKLSRKLKVKKIKVGHAGTLDPLATGVMIVCTGRATKRIDEFQYQTKEYIELRPRVIDQPGGHRPRDMEEILYDLHGSNHHFLLQRTD